jgi:hypothetical protein
MISCLEGPSATRRFEVTITVEIEASANDGFDDEVRRTASENARTLKFDARELEE